MERKLIKDNHDEVVRILFRHFGLKYDAYVRSIYHEHPRFRSVEAISYVLSRYGVDSSLIKTNLEELKNLPSPLVINYDGLFLPVAGVGDDGTFVIINESGSQEEINLTATDKYWNHLALVLDKDGKGAGNLVREKLLWLLRRAAMYISFAFVVAAFLYLTVKSFLLHDLLRDIFFVTTVAGLYVSVLFHIQKLNRGNPFVNKICHSSSGHSSKRDCASILDSNASKFLGIFSWVDIGSVYFLVFLAVIWFLPARGATTSLALVSLLALTYVPYSIYYQARIAKHWCPLCLSVQAVLLLNALVSLAYLIVHGVTPNALWLDAVKAGGVALLVLPVYSALIYLLATLYVRKERDKKYREYLFSADGIRSMVYGMPEIDMTTSNKITALDRGGDAELTMVVNPLCSPCMKKTREVLEILNRKRYTNLSIIFLVDAKSITEKAYAKKLISASLDGNLLEALEAHVKRFPQLEEFEVGYVFNPNAKGILESQLKWCDEHHLMSTPQTYLDGHKLSPLFSVQDIDYITE